MMYKLHEVIETTPAAVWAAGTAAPAASVFTSREWLGLPRWPGDGAGYLVHDRTLLPFRVMADAHGWSSMNLVDICAGEAFEVDTDRLAVDAVREILFPHLVVAAPGYHTVPIGDRRAGALEALVDAFVAEARIRGTTLGFAHLPPEAGDLTGILRARGFRIGITSATARLDLPGQDFDGYLATLGSGRRSMARRERARFEAAGGTVRAACGEEMSPLLPVAAELEAELNRSHGFDAAPEYFLDTNREYLSRFGDRMHLLCAELRGEPVATVTVFAGDHDLVARSVGLRLQPAVRHAAVYFNVYFYATIALAQRLGLRTIRFGTRAWDSKAARGARTIPLRTALAPDAPRQLVDLLDRTDAAARTRGASLSREGDPLWRR
jgi:hypothetical protein